MSRAKAMLVFGVVVLLITACSRHETALLGNLTSAPALAPNLTTASHPTGIATAATVATQNTTHPPAIDNTTAARSTPTLSSSRPQAQLSPTLESGCFAVYSPDLTQIMGLWQAFEPGGTIERYYFKNDLSFEYYLHQRTDIGLVEPLLATGTFTLNESGTLGLKFRGTINVDWQHHFYLCNDNLALENISFSRPQLTIYVRIPETCWNDFSETPPCVP